MNSPKIDNLRQKYPVFEYQSFSWEKHGHAFNLRWTMVSNELIFQPTLSLYLPTLLTNVVKEVIDELVFQLGLAEIPSYWKATCSPTILISAGYLSKPQIKWWEDLYLKGMGQYFYENKIGFTDPHFLTINNKHQKSGTSYLQPIKSKLGPLVLVSDGKDTATTLGIFSKANLQFDSLSIQRSTSFTSPLLKQFQIKNTSRGVRGLDPTLLNLNKDNFLNGHIPLSAYLAFAGLLTAYLQGNNEIIVSNEASSNEGNVNWKGHSINHQYSKTFEFEQKLQSYLHNYLNLGINYFSFLRPLFELQITGLLAHFPHLLPHFSSCNVMQAKGTTGWCCTCPKCLSTYLMLIPFLGEEKTSSIFGKNLLAMSEQLNNYKALLGKSTHKPFECVSTFEEIILASYLALKQYSLDSLPTLLKYFQSTVLPAEKNLNTRLTTLLSHFGKNLLKEPYLSILQQRLPIEVE